MLSAATKSHALARAREKGVATIPGVIYLQSIGLVFKVAFREARHEAAADRPRQARGAI